jgi:myo-inositol catabolism protein IolC
MAISKKASVNASVSLKRFLAKSRAPAANAPIDDLLWSFEAAVAYELVKAFAIGRAVFGDAAQAWLCGKIDDAAAIDQMADRFGLLVSAWERLKGK